MIWRCCICLFVALTLKKLLSHVNSLHSCSPDFRVLCGIDGCPNEYRVYNSYYYHIKRTHAHHLHNVALGPGDDEATSRPGTHQETTDSNVNISVAEDYMHTDTTQNYSSETEDNSFRDTRTVGYCFSFRILCIYPAHNDILFRFSLVFKYMNRLL